MDETSQLQAIQQQLLVMQEYQQQNDYDWQSFGGYVMAFKEIDIAILAVVIIGFLVLILMSRPKLS